MSRTIETIEDLQGLRAISAEWNELASRFKTPLLRHEWFLACAESFCPPGKLSIRVVRDDGRITAIAPLVYLPTFGIKRLELLGVGILNEPSGFLYENEEVLSTLLDDVLSSRPPIYFSGILSGSVDFRHLEEATKEYKLTNTTEAASPWLPLDQCWESYQATLSSSRRSGFRRAQRHAEELGTVQFEMITPTPATLDATLPEILQVEGAGWKSRTGTAMQAHKGLSCFFKAYARYAAALGMLRFAVLRINNKAVAVQMLVESANRLWILKVGYDESFSRCSPGILLMNRVIQHAYEKKYEAFEFLGRHEAWLDVWNPQIHVYETLRCYPMSPITTTSHGVELCSKNYRRLRVAITKKGVKTAFSSIIKKAITRPHGLHIPAHR